MYKTGLFTHNILVTFRLFHLANLEPKHLLKVCRLADEEQVEGPASAEISHNDGVHRHGGEEGPPGCVELL